MASVIILPRSTFIMLVSNNREVMGACVNGLLTNFIGWATVAVMAAASLGIFLTWGR